MQQTGILILTSPVRHLVDTFGNHLTTASKHVSKKLYIKLEPGQDKLHPPLRRQASDLKFLCKFIPALYSSASKYCSGTDVRLLLTSFKNPTYVESHLTPSHIDLALTDSSDPPASVKQYVNEQFQKPCLHVMKLNKPAVEINNATENGNVELYKIVILGGTFDRLHNGHKILLSTAVSRATEKIIVGVTDGLTLKKKQLWELIEPLEVRIKNVTDFLKDIDPTLECSVVPIYDPFGPAIEEPDIDCIVVSDETSLGGKRVNEERLKRNMTKLDVLTISLLDNPHHVIGDEEKISSSNFRKTLLGTLLKKTECKSFFNPLSIALIGGSMNGKSSICNCMEKLGVPVVDTYSIIVHVLTTSPQICQEISGLAPGIFGSNGEINMKNLNLLLLRDQMKREVIKSLIFPTVKYLVEQKIKQYEDSSRGPAILVKIAELFQDEWQNDFNHTWISILPESQRIQKLKNFYGISEEEASHIISVQPSNGELVQRAHMAFSPQWNEDHSMQQVQKAYERLKCWTATAGSNL